MQAWVQPSVTADAPHLANGWPVPSDHTLPLGYGVQWWLPGGTDAEFNGIGVCNPFAYVDPSRGGDR